MITRQPLATCIIGVTLLAGLPVLLGQWQMVVPYWYNSLALTPPLRRLLPGLLVLAIYLAGTRLCTARPGLAVIWSLVGSLAITVALLAPVGDPLYVLFTRTVSPQTAGGFTAGMAMTPSVLHTWADLMPGWRQYLPHLAISFPGWPLLYSGLTKALSASPAFSRALADVLRPLQCSTWDWRLNQATNAQLASAWFGIASPLWAALTVVPLYGVGRRVAGEEIAHHAVIWWPLVPAVTVFVANLNTAYPVLGTFMLYLAWIGIERKLGWWSVLWFFLVGLVMGGMLLLSLSLAPLLLLIGLVALLAWRPVASLKLVCHLAWCCALAAALGAGIIVIAAVYGVAAGGSPIDIFRTAMNQNLGMQRAYLPSLALHVWDFAIYVGLPAAGLAVAAIWSPRPSGLSRLGLATGLTLLILLFSGTAQGEVGRVWQYLMPTMLLLAGAALRGQAPATRSWLMITQAFWLVLLSVSNRPVDTWLGMPPAYAEVARPALQTGVIPTEAVFGDEMRLNGFQSQYDPTRHSVVIALHWQALRQVEYPYYFSAVLVEPGGRSLPGVHWQPFGKAYPTTCWRPKSSAGEIVDQIELPLGANAAAGSWWLSLSAFAMEGDHALPPLVVHLTNGQQDHQVGIGPIPLNW